MDKMNWLPLIEFSNKHTISISTLRRRIKDKSIEFKLEDGKYFIADEPVQNKNIVKKVLTTNKNKEAPRTFTLEQIAFEEEAQEAAHSSRSPSQPIIDEIKKAYMQVLQEKEENIFHLKEEVSDLKTLVKVLEYEVRRLTNSNSTETIQTDL